jgi:hypothetical protein
VTGFVELLGLLDAGRQPVQNPSVATPKSQIRGGM